MSRLPESDSFLWQNLPSDPEWEEGDEEDEEEEEDDGGWQWLPTILLEEIFSYLNLRDRYHSSIVCRRWYEAFYSPTLWRRLVLTSTTFTHQRYIPVKGYWTELSHHKVSPA